MKGLFGDLFDLNGDGTLDFAEQALELHFLMGLASDSKRRAFFEDDEEPGPWDELDGLLDGLGGPRGGGWDEDFDDDLDGFGGLDGFGL